MNISSHQNSIKCTIASMENKDDEMVIANEADSMMSPTSHNETTTSTSSLEDMSELSRQLAWHQEKVTRIKEAINGKKTMRASSSNCLQPIDENTQEQNREKEEMEEQKENSVTHEEDDSTERKEEGGPFFSSPSPIFHQWNTDGHNKYMTDNHKNKKNRFSVSEWPRTCSCLLGVLLPLLALMGLSLLFGLAVAHYEAPYELQQNDIKLQHQANAGKQQTVVKNQISLVPKSCFELFVLNETQTIDQANSHLRSNTIYEVNQFTDRQQALKDEVRNTILMQEEATSSSNTTSTTTTSVAELTAPENYTTIPASGGQSNKLLELYEWMETCGQEMITENIFITLNRIINSVSNDGDLTFHWIRCIPPPSSTTRDVKTSDQLQNQMEYVTAAWKADQKELREQYLQHNLDIGQPIEDANINSWFKSIEDATGSNVCEKNVAAAGWFWFTIQTTIGYGNQAPRTVQGRTLVYTLGFVSILAFGAIVGTAGLIASAIMDDFLTRFKMVLGIQPTNNKSPYILWATCLLWGIFYYSWMLIVAGAIMQWKNNRLSEEDNQTEFTFGEGYWFAYISSTTVGLGDIILEPEAIQFVDVIVFPLLFLINFVFISAFLAKLGEALGSVMRMSFVEDLVKQLQKDIFDIARRRELFATLSKSERRRSQLRQGSTGIMGLSSTLREKKCDDNDDDDDDPHHHEV